MTMYKRVGFFFEETESDQRKLLRSLENEKAHPREADIIRYLSSGIDAGAAMIVEHDYMKTPPLVIGEAVLQSDGEWIWPSSLVYYVSEYHISLPEEFIIKMEQNNWVVPLGIELHPEIPEGHVEM